MKVHVVKYMGLTGFPYTCVHNGSVCYYYLFPYCLFVYFESNAKTNTPRMGSRTWPTKVILIVKHTPWSRSNMDTNKMESNKKRNMNRNNRYEY